MSCNSASVAGHETPPENESEEIPCSEGDEKKKRWPKKKVYKKADPRVPKQRRFSGYYVYMRERREQLLKVDPSMSQPHIIRQLASEWTTMDRHTKQKYRNTANEDKMKYLKQLESKKVKKSPSPKVSESEAAMNMMSQETHNDNNNFGTKVPIFTDGFLEHNKARELELRLLKKSVTECGQQNANLREVVNDWERKIDIQRHKIEQIKLQNNTVSENLKRLRTTFVSSFESAPLPGTNAPPTMDTIDEYMNQVKAMMENKDKSEEFAPFISKVRDIFAKIQL